jgi:AmmeMemoRadiSam system protein A
VHNACAAAFADPRFPAVVRDELPHLHFCVSVLSPLRPVPFADEADLLASLRPGDDGLVLGFGAHRGVFLPQVWATLPEARTFWRALKRKAGLDADAFDPGFRVERFTVQKFEEAPR